MAFFPRYAQRTVVARSEQMLSIQLRYHHLAVCQRQVYESLAAQVFKHLDRALERAVFIHVQVFGTNPQRQWALASRAVADFTFVQ